MVSPELDRVRGVHQQRSLRLVSLLRLFAVVVMVVAIEVGVETRWREELVLVTVYGMLAVGIAGWAVSAAGRSRTALRLQFWFAVVDIAVIFGFKMLSPPGAYVPLLVMTLLPMMVVVDVSWRRAAAVLAAASVAFAVEVFRDPLLVPQYGWGRPALAVMIYFFLCLIALLAVRAQARYVDEIAALTVSREELLAESMTAVDEQQRTISEFLHDGPLQSVLAARLDVQAHLKRGPDEGLQRVLSSLRDASRDLREATFELHPAVLEHAGLAAAVVQLAANVSERSGIPIGTSVDYPDKSAVDPLLFGVVRELLSNVVRHSRASEATVTLAVMKGVGHLYVSDDGIGLSPEIAAGRLAEGHIGLASHRARVEAAGGLMTIEGTSPGTRVHIALPLR